MIRPIPLQSFLLAATLSWLLLTAASAAETADLLLGEWVGTYTCAQGHTGVSLSVESASGLIYTGKVNFFALPENPGVPNGSYKVEGMFDPRSRDFVMKGVEWILRPSGYQMVDASGALSSDGTRIAGRIEFIGCTDFTMTRKGAPPTSGEVKP